MASEILNHLYEVTVSICDGLYAQKKLITQSSVMARLTGLENNWSQEELSCIPDYINNWRLSNLSRDTAIKGMDEVVKLQKELAHARYLIQRLKNDLRTLLQG